MKTEVLHPRCGTSRKEATDHEKDKMGETRRLTGGYHPGGVHFSSLPKQLYVYLNTKTFEYTSMFINLSLL